MVYLSQKDRRRMIYVWPWIHIWLQFDLHNKRELMSLSLARRILPNLHDIMDGGQNTRISITRMLEIRRFYTSSMAFVLRSVNIVIKNFIGFFKRSPSTQQSEVNIRKDHQYLFLSNENPNSHETHGTEWNDSTHCS